VTTDAIYHHFASTRDLFLAVMERRWRSTPGPSTRLRLPSPVPGAPIVAAFDAFLGTIADPVYQWLCFVRAGVPRVEDCWAWRERTEIDLIRRQLDRVAQAGALLVEEVDMLAHVLFGVVAGRGPGHGPGRRPRGGSGSSSAR
jgi:AcrR family transcriptional regulator